MAGHFLDPWPNTDNINSPVQMQAKSKIIKWSEYKFKN